MSESSGQTQDKENGAKVQRNRSQSIILWILSTVLILFTFLVWQWVEERRSRFPLYPSAVSEFCIVGPLCLLVALVHLSVKRIMLPIARCVILRQGKSEAVYESKLSRFGSVTFKLIFTSVLCYLTFETFLKDAEWMPSQMFGKGDVKLCWGHGNLLDTQAPISKAGKFFYQMAFAYHLSELLLQILFEPHKPDYMEMFIHHSATIFLIFTSFAANMIRIGSLVLFLHYVSDIPVYAAKMFVDTKLKIVTASCLVGMLVSWGYLRLYVFPFVLIRSTAWDTLPTVEAYGGAVKFIWYSCNVALSALLCLHIYWYSLFLKMGWVYVTKGKTEDKQANLNKIGENGEANGKND